MAVGFGPGDQRLEGLPGGSASAGVLGAHQADVAAAGERVQLLKNLAIVGGLLLVIDQDGEAREGNSPDLKNFRGTLRRCQKQGEYPSRVWVFQRGSAGFCKELQGADFETQIMSKSRDFFRVSFSLFDC